MIEGMVRSGIGQAAAAFTAERCDEVEALFGFRPYPGTLNLGVVNMESVIEWLGEPAALTEEDTPIGPLRWWPVLIGGPWPYAAEALVVRGVKSRSPSLEIVAPFSLRKAGARDGDYLFVSR